MYQAELFMGKWVDRFAYKTCHKFAILPEYTEPLPTAT